MTEAAAEDVAWLRPQPGRDDELVLALGGRLDAAALARVWPQGLAAIRAARKPALRIDAAAVTYCDGAGSAMLQAFDRAQQAHGRPLLLEGFPEAYQPIVDLLRDRDDPLCPPVEQEPTPPWESFAEQVGRHTVAFVREFASLIGYIGEISLALVASLRNPRMVRWSDCPRAMQSVGVEAFPVVMLVSFLLGLITSFQSADILHRFGADVFLPWGLSLSMARELGPVMTAIVLCARSGSAFAAELGTMRVNEELDALDTMGISTVRFLIVPRVLATILVTPVLSMFAVIAGIAGGAVVWLVVLDLPMVTFRSQVLAAVERGDLIGGLLKALAFGLLIAGVGCVRGLQTRGASAGVGRAATRAVVSGIVLIAAADAVFAVVFYTMGW